MQPFIDPFTGERIGEEAPDSSFQTAKQDRSFVDPFTGETISYQVDATPPAYDDRDELTDSVSLADYGKSIMAGGAGVGAGFGWLLKKLGTEHPDGTTDGVFDFGKAIETLGNDAVDYWNDSLSDAAKTELAKEFVSKDENGEWQWGDASLSTVGLYGAQSLLGTAAGMGVGAGITKTLQVFGNPVARAALVDTIQAGRGAAAGSAAAKAATAASKKLKLVDRVRGAAGFGLGEGSIGGMMTGANVEEQIRSLDIEKLMSSPRFMEIYDANVQSGVDADTAMTIARDTLAKEGSSVAGFQAGLTTSLLGAPMGAFFGPLFGRAGIRETSRLAATGIGAAGEAGQEFAQSGVEALITNKELIAAGDPRDLFDDVLNQAIGGAAAGAAMGGGFGFAAGADAEAIQQRDRAKVKKIQSIVVGDKEVSVKPLRERYEAALEAGVPPEELLPILEQAAQPGGMLPAVKKLRELTDAKLAEEPASVDEALADVEANRPQKKGKRKKKAATAPESPPTAPEVPEVPAPEVSEKVEQALESVAGTAETDEDVAAQAHEAATSPENDRPEPTEAQKEYGNYKKGPVKLAHLPNILIENPDGSVRKGKGWERTMQGVHYGYFPRTEGADNQDDGTPREGVDAMVNATEGATDANRPVFVINQLNEDGSFDEHKVMVGFATEAEARAAYENQYEAGWKGFGSAVEMTAEEFGKWVKDPANTTQPVAAPATPGGASEQFENYKSWIDSTGAEKLRDSPGVLEEIRMDERLEDGEAQQLEALWQGKTAPSAPAKTYPQPNQHGVYPKSEAKTDTFKGGKKKKNVTGAEASASISVLQIGENEWVSTSSYDFSVGDFSGASGPLSKAGKFATQEEAYENERQSLIKSMRGIAEGAGGSGRTDVQRAAARDILQQLGYESEPSPPPTPDQEVVPETPPTEAAAPTESGPVEIWVETTPGSSAYGVFFIKPGNRPPASLKGSRFEKVGQVASMDEYNQLTNDGFDAGRDTLAKFKSKFKEAPAAPTDITPKVFEGTNILTTQDFGDLEITEEAEIEDTGEVVELNVGAQAEFARVSRRITTLQQLLGCVGG